ncbi:recombinase family protein [Geotalea daltonii]
MTHLANTIHDLANRVIGFKVLSGHGASIDTTTPAGKLVFGIFAALAEFERELISERTKQDWPQLVPVEGQVERPIK